MSLKERFEKFEDLFLKFEGSDNPFRIGRPDICAFLMLNDLCPSDRDMISYASHDEITLEVSPSEVEKVITDAQIEFLVRCGVRFSKDNDCFEMFV